MEDDGSRRDEYEEVVPIGAVLVAALAGTTMFGAEVNALGEVNEGAQAAIGLEDDVPPLASITAIGATVRDELFAAEADYAVSAVASLYPDLRLVNEQNKAGGD